MLNGLPSSQGRLFSSFEKLSCLRFTIYIIFEYEKNNKTMLILKIIPPNDHKAIFITFNNMSHDSMGFKFYQNKAFPALGIYLREHCKFRADDHILYLTKGEFIDRVEMIMDKESFDNAYSKTLLNNFKP